jgi:NADPH:quinone reductase-like Zn-dependent oxidoreductase
MKVAYCARYGPPGTIAIREAPQPVPRDTEILVTVRATTVTSADWRQRAGDFPGIFSVLGRPAIGLRGPRRAVLGGEFAGVVSATGARVTGFRPGDAVFGFAGSGAHAEYLAIEEAAPVLRMPDGWSFAEAAAIPFGAFTALVFLRDRARLQPGERVLVVGASGGVGVSAVQIARHLGGVVDGVCGPDHADLVRSLGADRVIDRHRDSYLDGSATWDVILDTVGATTFPACRNALTPAGRHVALEFGLTGMAWALVTRFGGGRRAVVGISGETRADLALIARLMADGALRPVIDGRYPFAAIAEAHARAESRRKRGSVVVTMLDPPPHPIAAN